jgi:uncharacterized membrane protein required for colicin V production
MSAAIILDLIVVGIIAVFLIRGLFKGLVMMLAGLVSLAAGVFGGSCAAKVLSKPVADAIILPWVRKTLDLAAQGRQIPEGAAVAEGGGLSESAMGSISGVMESSKLPGFSFRGVMDSIGKHVQDTGASLLDAASQVVAERIAYVILFIVAFVLIIVIVLLLFRLFNIVSKAPVLNTLNKISGGIVGLVTGALVVLLLMWFVTTFVKPATAEGALLSEEVIEATYIAKYFDMAGNMVIR